MSIKCTAGDGDSGGLHVFRVLPDYEDHNDVYFIELPENMNVISENIGKDTVNTAEYLGRPCIIGNKKDLIKLLEETIKHLKWEAEDEKGNEN